MTIESFISALKSQTSDAALYGIMAALHRPPGRKPSEKDLRLSSWYGGFGDEDQQMAFAAMREAAELAVFSFLCILDGVSAIENAKDKGELQLTYTKGSEVVVLTNPEQEPLHDVYNDLCRSSDPLPPTREATREYATGLASFLRSIQTSTDGLDIQPLPREHTVPQNPGDESAISLPKAEHRKF